MKGLVIVEMDRFRLRQERDNIGQEKTMKGFGSE